jgi:plastocyanin
MLYLFKILIMKTTKRCSGTRYFAIPVIILLFGLFLGCSKSSGYATGDGGNPGSPGANEVWLQNMAFTPSSITVAVGTTVTWTNKDSYNHHVVSDSPLFDSGILSGGGTFPFKFTMAGNYTYKCTIHPSMTGVIIVQ